jgi:hypothetical protein
MRANLSAAVVLLAPLLSTAPVRAWDETGHVIVTELAIDGLPPTVPAWVRSPENRARLCYLAAEPDRWRGQKEPVLDHINAPDHYLDVEDLAMYGLRLDALPRFRNEFIERLAAVRAAEPGRIVNIDPGLDKDHTKTVPGLLPYAIEELRWKIASSWSTLRTFEEYRDVATEAELAAARNNVIQHMGLISHFVGDAAQPLHLTKHHHGWVGPNPKGYTTERSFHSYIDGGVIDLHGINAAALRPRIKPPTRFDPKDDWAQIAAMLQTSFDRVEPLYALDKSGELKRTAGRTFIENCLLDGGANLSGIWVTAYESSGIDAYLAKRLKARRRVRNGQPAAAASQPASGGSSVSPGAAD